MLGFFLEAETLILPDSVQKAQWKQIVERFTSLDAETFRQLTRRDGLDKALQALDLAAASNIHSILLHSYH